MKIVLREPIAYPIITQGFGKDFKYFVNGKYVDFYKDLYNLDGHPGIDYRAIIGTPIYSSNDGEVLYSGYDNTNGNMIQVWNKELGFKTLYGHLSERKVKTGDEVKAGDVIGLSGNTGAGTGPHLHFGFKYTNETGGTLKYDEYNGASDPAPFIKLDYKGKIKTMILKKEKGSSAIYLVNDKYGTMIKFLDMESLNMLCQILGQEADYQEVDSLAGYIVVGTQAIFKRNID